MWLQRSFYKKDKCLQQVINKIPDSEVEPMYNTPGSLLWNG